MNIPAALRRLVAQRAQGRCEYCGLSQLGQAASFHIDHIHPMASGGETVAENLALACIHCSLRKGARRMARDPVSARMVPLYHPRQDLWNHHFRWRGVKMTGITPKGRATIAALSLNGDEHQTIRAFEARLGRHPPPGHQ